MLYNYNYILYYSVIQKLNTVKKLQNNNTVCNNYAYLFILLIYDIGFINDF